MTNKEQRFKPGDIVRLVLTGEKVMVLEKKPGASPGRLHIRREQGFSDVYCEGCELEPLSKHEAWCMALFQRLPDTPVAAEEARENACDHCGGKILGVKYCSINQCDRIERQYCTDSCRRVALRPSGSTWIWSGA